MRSDPGAGAGLNPAAASRRNGPSPVRGAASDRGCSVNSDRNHDIAVIGAGIAGASVAAELARATRGALRIVLLEMEDRPGYHTTGRSAAIYAPTYGPPPIRALTRAARAFFDAPPAGFAPAPLLRPLEAVFVARPDQRAALDAMAAEFRDQPDIAPVGPDWLARHVPLLRPGYAAGGLLDRSTHEIDVAALHQGYIGQFRALGGRLLTRAEVTALKRREGAWHLQTAAGPVRAETVVNAAGAWAGRVGEMAGAERIGLRPLRRTAMTVAAPPGCDTAALPMVIDIEERFYLKPDAGQLLISPANEDPEPPCDVQPDEMDVALCVDRIERAFDLQIRRIGSRWAGLRSFVADRCPVAGWSRAVPGFYWLAGQGGYGIQSAPALARFAAAGLLDRPVPQDILDAGLDPATLAPDRPALAGG